MQQQHCDGIDNLFDSIFFRSCLTSLDCQEAWNLQVIACMMGFYLNNMQHVQSVQNMQQNIPAAQMPNPALWLQYFGAVATSQAASRETIQNHSQSYAILGCS